MWFICGFFIGFIFTRLFLVWLEARETRVEKQHEFRRPDKDN